jgi:predicted O-methyltransferase YrrM
MRYGVPDYIKISASTPGWMEGQEAIAVYEASYALDDNAVIVELGAFFGRTTVLLAGARKLRGSGKVHSVDPFDCSGDAVSVPQYHRILEQQGGGSLRTHFDENLRRAGLSDWVEVRQARASDAAAHWETPVDLLLLDGDQSPRGAREAYEAWIPHLRQGGILILGNSISRDYAEGHDGYRRLVVEEVVCGEFADIRQVGFGTFARKVV